MNSLRRRVIVDPAWSAATAANAVSSCGAAKGAGPAGAAWLATAWRMAAGEVGVGA